MQTNYCRGSIIPASLLLFLCNVTIFSQIAVHINSGNPVFPFPQFLSYDNPTQKLGNLATHNAPGVCHAEMEQSIRDAYQIMMNRTNKTGTSLNGVDFLKYTSSPDCTEGDGYVMLAAAAMADKTTFDGLWLWIHDNAMNKVVRYSTGQPAPAYNFSSLPGWQNASGTNSATDGDVDIGLALLTAYRQWGEFMGTSDSKGNPISYKHDLIEFLKGLTDTLVYSPTGRTYVSGDIGLDGYLKSGDSWSELTDWANDTARSGLRYIPEMKGPTKEYADYMAPAYFHEFADFLVNENPSLYGWNIRQFQRCEASSDWIMGQLLANPRMVPCAGYVDLSSANAATFSQASQGEDFRLSWRTILNYVWHGNPSSTWDPLSHQFKTGTANAFERDIGSRYAKFLWDNRQSPWNNSCVTISGPNTTGVYWGPSVLWTNWKVDGSGGNFFHLNWIQGTGSPSAVTAQDYQLMGEMYRQCEIMWSVDAVGDGYLTSIPHYYHDWFRLLGMLVLSGNYSTPSAIKPGANMKVYLDVDKTCASKGDTITYTISYRNYGSIDAQNVSVVDTLPADFSFVSCSSASTFQASSRAVTISIGTVPGFKTATGIPPTTGKISLKVALAATTSRRYVNKVSITCGNGSGWTSNEYPNTVSPVMKRNIVDALSQPMVNGTFAGVNPLYGGRPGVHFSYAVSANTKTSDSKIIELRVLHDAQESYIDNGNYRFSIFLYDTARKCLKDSSGCVFSWQVIPYFFEGVDKTAIKIFQESMTPGQDSLGKWNQRIVVQFSNPSNPNRLPDLAGPYCFLEQYLGNAGTEIHRGETVPLRVSFNLSTNYIGPQSVWNDDWSWDSNSVDVESGMYWPITNDWTDPDNPNVPVTTWDPKACSQANHVIRNILVEEWDGYTWRKVAGSSPVDLATALRPVKLQENKASMVVSFCGSEISYTLPSPENVRIQILDIKGRIVATLIDSFQKTGSHSMRWDMQMLTPNVYFVRFQSGKECVLKKLIPTD